MDQSFGLVSYDPYIEAEHFALKLNSARHNRDDHRTRPRLTTPSTMFPSSFVDRWSRSIKTRRHEQLHDFPNYHLSNPEELVTTSNPQSITVGSGVSIYKQTLLPAILTAHHEVILVTCFWAESDTLRALHETLHELAKHRRETIASNADSSALPRLRIRIGFSSRSFFQKIFHPWSRDGHAYRPSAWAKLGLPPDDVLKAARIDLSVKSLFFLPFSVMHPKFVIVDRERAFMPSCNISWEVWFEGCVEFTGPAVEQLLRFYASVWDGNVRQVADWDDSRTRDAQSIPPIEPTRNEPDSACQKRLLDPTPTPTMILPSSHHVNPSFRYIPFLGRLTSPATPLNAALLDLFASAQTQIDIITPNLTCRAVVDALLASLARGVNVRIRTSRNMMLIEQLVTACTTTEWTIRSLINRYEALTASWTSRAFDMEAQRQRPGRLEIYYYRPATKSPDEPVVSHLKMTLVDREYLMLGSGNLDRASWYTSQELGILLHVPGFEHDIWSAVLNTRMDVRYRLE
ncbi:uncharacterized protein VDAG_10453 [Verticillium dahliae VdLs.17]|uniref:PLD phosphodiesterase domain-containing protein n=2 Tax=Verticillium dahliae TaxID=27337 RepID=G2XJX1_VERDV|nr:uncharacterized protein VDAG_10453 [Verticillium dahliae VdLs.17]EGY21471.1 hypothetical protein VDAG_10453 [Verticillium dahliae VdLs.17]